MSAKIKKLLQNGTFCALPFIHWHQDLDGSRALCCSARRLSDTVNEENIPIIRQKILQGKRVDWCQNCYDADQEGRISPRIKQSLSWIKDPDACLALESAIDDVERSNYVSFDLRFDNQCNLACAGCNSRDSSLWQQLEKKTIPVEVPDPLSKTTLEKARLIYIAGGEPLINDKVYKLLEKIVGMPRPPEIVINSNIAAIKPRFFELLYKIENLSISVSIDGAKKVNEYHRWPLQWNKFLQNHKELKKFVKFLSWSTVLDAISVWGIAEMIEYEDLCDAWDLKILAFPEDLKLNHTPVNLKPQAKQQIEKLRESKFYNNSFLFKQRVEKALELLDQDGDPELLSKKIQSLDKMRGTNHIDYLELNLI